MTMKRLDEIELHDALIKSINVDFELGSARIDIAYHVSADTRDRVHAVLVFEGVESVHQVSSVTRIRQSSIAGNINYWVPNGDGGTTYIYLVDGCIAVTSKTVRIDQTQATA
jgi:hypothetical protein